MTRCCSIACFALAACHPDGAPVPSDSALRIDAGEVVVCSDGEAMPTWVARDLPHPPMPLHRFAGGGVAVLDADGDGILDLILPGPEGVVGWRGPDFAASIPLPALTGELTGVVAADADADGDADLFFSRFGEPDVFWRHDPDGFVPVVLGIEGGPSHSQSAAWSDLDGDGWLDLVVAGHGQVGVDDDQVIIEVPGDPTRLHLGGPGLQFSDATAMLPQRFHDAYSFVVAPIHLDDDEVPDLFAANDHPAWIPQLAAYNRGVDAFELDDGSTGLSPRGAGMGLGIGDIDGDGVDELLLPIWNGLMLLRSFPGGWAEASAATGLRLPQHAGAWVGWGAELVDLDLDRHLDAVVAFGHLDAHASLTVGGASSANVDEQPVLTWLGGDTGFTLTDANFPHDGVHRGLVMVDLNGDGVLDFVAPDLAGGVDLRISTCSTRSWLAVDLRWLEGGNREAIGAVVRVDTPTGTISRTVRAGGTGLMSSGPSTLHFGLGDLDEISLSVTWPDGRVDEVGPVEGRRRVTLTRAH